MRATQIPAIVINGSSLKSCKKIDLSLLIKADCSWIHAQRILIANS